MTQQEIRIRLYAAIGDMTIEAAAHDLGEFGTVTAWRRADRLLAAYNEIVGSDADDLIRLAIDMREKQKTYFRTRDRDALEASKAVEREFDAVAKAWAKTVSEPGLL